MKMKVIIVRETSDKLFIPEINIFLDQKKYVYTNVSMSNKISKRAKKGENYLALS